MKCYKILSLCIGVVLALLLGEFTARCYYFLKTTTDTLILSENKKLRFEHKPSITFVNKHGVTMRYNSLGFIGDEIGEKKENTVRILGIGDSITEAKYLPENRRYLNLTEAILKQKTKRNIEVINAGVSAYNTWQELELLRQKNPVVKADIILVQICLNDFVYEWFEYKKTWFNRIKARDGSRARYFSFVYQRSDLYKFLYDFLSRVRRVWLSNMKEFYRYHEQFSLPKPADFEQWKKPYEEMLAYAQENNIKIFFFIFPVNFQLLREQDATFRPLSDFFDKKGAYFLDLIKLFRQYYSEEKPLFRNRDFVHPTALGHSIAAKAIADYMVQHKLIEQAASIKAH